MLAERPSFLVTGGPRKRRAVKVEGDTRVFAEGALPQAPGGGALTTYRELCSASFLELCWLNLPQQTARHGTMFAGRFCGTALVQQLS